MQVRKLEALLAASFRLLHFTNRLRFDLSKLCSASYHQQLTVRFPAFSVLLCSSKKGKRVLLPASSVLLCTTPKTCVRLLASSVLLCATPEISVILLASSVLVYTTLLPAGADLRRATQKISDRLSSSVLLCTTPKNSARLQLQLSAAMHHL